jgi:hypothetical protein
VTNTFATIPGIVGVYITGYILQVTNYNWTIVFLLAAGVLLFSLLFLFLASFNYYQLFIWWLLLYLIFGQRENKLILMKWREKELN